MILSSLILKRSFLFVVFLTCVLNVFDDWLPKILKKQWVFDILHVGEVGSQDGPKMGPRRPRHHFSKHVEKPL